ncbi:MAG: NAD(P)H-binding protein [Proteobacteria bacterium]|nr:NAD(P)H-binding protein [Pseudomonadota bacterium]
MSNTVLVTGATGTTGRRLVPMLRDRGVTVRAASRNGGIGGVAFDWHDAATHAQALAGVDAIYLIPPPLMEDPTPVVAPFLAEAVAAGVKRVVLLSSMGVAFPGEPADSGRRKLEAAVRGSGLQWTILRPSGFMQNFSEGFLVPAVRHGGIPNPAGNGKVAMIDAEDIARVAAATLIDPAMHAGQTYDLTGPELLDFDDLARGIAQVTQRPVATMPMEPQQFLAMVEQAGVPADYAAMLLRDQVAIRDGAAAIVADTVARISGRRAIDFTTFTAQAAPVWMS